MKKILFIYLALFNIVSYAFTGTLKSQSTTIINGTLVNTCTYEIEPLKYVTVLNREDCFPTAEFKYRQTQNIVDDFWSAADKAKQSNKNFISDQLDIFEKAQKLRFPK